MKRTGHADPVIGPSLTIHRSETFSLRNSRNAFVKKFTVQLFLNYIWGISFPITKERKQNNNSNKKKNNFLLLPRTTINKAREPIKYYSLYFNSACLKV